MPILPENKTRYPANWPEIRKNIMARASNGGFAMCECEGECGTHSEWCGAINHADHPVTGSMVVLTIAHLDHTPENNHPSNLRAMCQKCHNNYDMDHRRETRAKRLEKERQALAMRDLFEGSP